MVQVINRGAGGKGNKDRPRSSGEEEERACVFVQNQSISLLYGTPEGTILEDVRVFFFFYRTCVAVNSNVSRFHD